MTNRIPAQTPDVPGEQTPLADDELERVAGGASVAASGLVSVVVKGSGSTLSGAPSVCLTPTAVGPVPIPYPVTTSVPSNLPSDTTKTKP